MSFLVNSFRFGAPATTWNPADKAAGVTLSNGNLTATVASGANQGVRSTTSKGAGSFHAEVTVDTNNALEFGIISGAASLTANLRVTNSVVASAGVIYVNGSLVAGLNGGTPGAGAVIAVEISGQDVWFQRSGQARQGPYTLSGAGPYFLAVSGGTGNVATANFGATAFTVTPTGGFGAWG